MSAAPRKTLLIEAWKRLRISRRFLVWLYVLNLVCGVFATAGLSSRIGRITDLSLYADRLSKGFDAAAFLELIAKPEVAVASQLPLAFIFSGAFVLMQIFLAGGILAEFLRGQPLTRKEFYAACGEGFWRFVGIAAIFAVFAGVTAATLHFLRSAIGNWTEDLSNVRIAFTLQCAMLLVEALALIWIRMWFDLAQLRLVAVGNSRVRPALAQAFTRSRHAGGLYVRYLLLTLLMAGVFGLGGVIWWMATPPSNVFVSFVVLQSILFCLLTIRWWQRALAASWYALLTPPVVAPIPELPVESIPIGDMPIADTQVP